MSRKNITRASNLENISRFAKRHFLLLTGIACALCAALCLFMFLPGGFSPDVGGQLDQALGLEQLTSWHPVAMALYWRFLLSISGGSIAMLCLMRVLVFWLGIFLITRFIYCKTSNKYLALLPVVLGLLPNVLVILHYNWKDSELASYLLLSLGLILNINIMKTVKNWQKVTKIILLALALGLIFYAMLVRTNGIFAAIPILVLWFDEVFKMQWRKIMGLWYYIAIICITLLTYVIVNQAIVWRFHPKIQSANVTMYIFDIVNILPKDQINRLQIDKNTKDVLLEYASGNCAYFNNGTFNVIPWDKACAPNEAANQLVTLSTSKELETLWINTIMRHPARWLAYSLTTYANWLTTGSTMPSFYGSYKLGDRFIPPKSTYGQKAFQIYNDNFGNKWLNLLYEKWFYLLLCLALLIVTIRSKLLKNRRIILSLLISSLLYILTYAPAALTSDYRYIFWTVISSMIALILILCEIDWKYFSDSLKRTWRFIA